MADVMVGDVLTLRKSHPCGGVEWRVTGVGADIRMKCLSCGRFVIMDRAVLKRQLRSVNPNYSQGTSE